MPSRGQTTTVTYVAWDSSANAGKTADGANHTLRWVKDGVSSPPTNTAAEVDGTNAPGVYSLVLTTTECTCNCGTLCGKSSTANVAIIPLTVTFEQLPTAVPNAANGLLTFGSSTGQVNPSGGKVPATLASTDVTGNVPADLQTIKTQAVTCAAGVTINPFVGTATAALAVNASGFVTLVDGSFTAAKVASAAITSSAFGTGAIDANAFAQAAADKVWASTGRTLSSFSFTVSADLQTIKAQAVTCSAGVTVGPFVGTTNLISTNGSGQVKVQSGTAAGQILTTNGAVSLAPPDSLAARTGTCQAGSTSTTIVLDSGASSTDDAYRGMLVRLTGGTGSSIYQTRTIVSYTGSTTTATLDRAWKTTPDNTTTFALIYANAPRLDTQLRVDIGNWLSNAVTLDANNLPNVAVKDWNGVAVGALPANFSSLAIDGSGNVAIVYADVWTAAGAPTVNLDGSVHADIVSINEVAVTFETIPTAAQNAAAVWDLTTSGHTTSGTFGAAMGAAGAAGDPMATDVATGYTGTQAGAIIKALDLNNVLTWRDQDDNATPNGHDSRFASWFAAFGHEGDPNPDGTIPGLAPDDTTIFTYDEAPGVTVAPDGLDLVIVEPTAGINMRQAMQGLLADSAGTLAGAGTGTIVINGANTSVPRIIATTDSLGNRLQVSFLFDV